MQKLPALGAGRGQLESMNQNYKAQDHRHHRSLGHKKKSSEKYLLSAIALYVNTGIGKICRIAIS